MVTVRCSAPCGSTHDEARPHHPLVDLVHGCDAFHVVDEDVHRLFAHHVAALFDGGQHGVAGYCALAVGESADGNVVRHVESHALGCIENADGRVVVDGKEGVGTVFAAQHMGRQLFGIGTVVAGVLQRVVVFQPMPDDGIVVSVEPVL